MSFRIFYVLHILNKSGSSAGQHMKRQLNEYVLTAGLLLLCMSVAHAIYGEMVVFSDLRFISFDKAMFSTIYLPWHQMSLVLLLSAVGLIFSSVKKGYKGIQFFVLLIIAGNLLMFIVIILANSGQVLFLQAWPQFFFFLILILLISLGMRKKEVPAN